MIVDYATGTGYTRQIVIPHLNDGIYLRTIEDSGSSFREWVKLVTSSEFDPVAQNVKGIKSWGVSEWVAAGGNLPPGTSNYGAVLRTRGLLEPGQVHNGSDSYYILQGYVDANTLRTWSGMNVAKGGKEVKWFQLG